MLVDLGIIILDQIVVEIVPVLEEHGSGSP